VERWFQNTRGLVIIVLAVLTCALLLATEPGDGFPSGVTTSDDSVSVTTTLASVPQATTTTIGKPTLQEGTPDTANTTVLQQRLIQLGYSVTADGSFGPGTKQAVSEFQTSKGLPATGVVDQATWNALAANPAPSTPTTTTKP